VTTTWSDPSRKRSCRTRSSASLLEEYSEARRRLSPLRVKRTVLQVEKHRSELADSAEYATLQDRTAELEADIDELEVAFDRKLGYER
jgi:hypothetical protein